MRSTRRGALCEAKNLPLEGALTSLVPHVSLHRTKASPKSLFRKKKVQSEAIKLKNCLIAREESKEKFKYSRRKVREEPP